MKNGSHKSTFRSFRELKLFSAPLKFEAAAKKALGHRQVLTPNLQIAGFENFLRPHLSLPNCKRWSIDQPVSCLERKRKKEIKQMTNDAETDATINRLSSVLILLNLASSRCNRCRKTKKILFTLSFGFWSAFALNKDFQGSRSV